MTLPVQDFQRCTRCVMDTTDARIRFDQAGVCDHCLSFEQHVLPRWQYGHNGRAELEQLVAKIKLDGRGRSFDCIIGMSGGLDSSYLLHAAVTEFGLRPLVFHVDGGWNSDLAVHNIERLIDGLGVDLYTEVINWEEMRDFQLSFFKSGVPHLDIPQDHAFIATLYRFAYENKIRYILNGGNFATECVQTPKEWFYYGTDLRHNRDIHRRFGSVPLKSYPVSGVLFHKMYLRYIRRIRVVKPLNLMPYTQEQASSTLALVYGWRSYEQKHFESRFTKFYEGYWLPTRFGYEPRKVHLSSLILTGQLTRDAALLELAKLPYDAASLPDDFEFIAAKLGISEDELHGYHAMPLTSYRDYRNREWMFGIGSRVLKLLGAERAVKR